jgi:hypothetical protein
MIQIFDVDVNMQGPFKKKIATRFWGNESIQVDPRLQISKKND